MFYPPIRATLIVRRNSRNFGGSFLRKATELVKSRLAAYKLHIPVFGDFLDVNDFWLISGLLIPFLLLILVAHLERQLANYRKAEAVCPNNTCRDLLIMSQVFVLPREDKARSIRVTQRILLITICFMPAILNLIIVWFDFTLNKGYFLLLGSTGTYIEFALRVISLFAVTYLGYRCYFTAHALEALVSKIHHTNFKS
jgi:hypothetical protein